MVHIVADTTSGLPQDIAAQYDIPVIPQVIHFGQESYLECIEMDSAMFMAKLLEADELPHTAAPPPELFSPYFERFSCDGEPVLCIHPSAKVSGTVRSATTAKQAFPDADIRVMDTLTIGGPLASMVVEAAKWAAEGLDADTIWDRLEDMKRRMHIYFTVNTLEYLQRGGRIGGAKALLGNLLQIRPILTFRDGQVEPFANERTRKRALRHMMHLASETAPRDCDPHFSVMHAAAPDIARQLVAELQAEFGDIPVMVMDLVPAIVTH
ncbi:MAG: DegV family protein, partial [Anaerolineae bacterium]|nr:DegV family protein [Anaerolineae bacterium]